MTPKWTPPEIAIFEGLIREGLARAGISCRFWASQMTPLWVPPGEVQNGQKWSILESYATRYEVSTCKVKRVCVSDVTPSSHAIVCTWGPSSLWHVFSHENA